MCYSDKKRNCSKFEYVLEASKKDANIQIVKFDQFLKLLDLNMKSLEKLPNLDIEYLLNSKYKK